MTSQGVPSTRKLRIKKRVCYTEMDEEEECEMMRKKTPKTFSGDEFEIEDGFEDENEKVEFDINIIIKQLEMQPTVEVYDV